jgi:glycosyltransferase
MKISLIIPNYNDLRIKRTLESVFNQTYKDLEVIVIDAVSTKEGISQIYDSFPIHKLICEKDEGIFDALNKGVKAASGDLIYLMGSDDFLPIPDTFEKAIIEFGKNVGLDGVCLGCEFISASGKVIRKWYPTKVSASRIKNGFFPPHFSLLLRKELYELVGDFKYKKYNNVACDILWLLDLAIKRPNLNIKVIRDRFLVMEYGGASTGSFSAIWRQFKVVHFYVAKTGIPSWPYMSAFRTFSKIFQIRFFNTKKHKV